MILKNKYCFGLLCMWYEVEMLEEHVDSCLQMLQGADNPENVTFYLCFSKQEYLEKIDKELLGPVGNKAFSKFMDQLERLMTSGCSVKRSIKYNDEPFFNIARFRRTLNFDYCELVDYIGWSETDSLWPKQTLSILEELHNAVKDSFPKFLLTFGYRRNWDASWDHLVHPLFRKVPFIDNDTFALYDEASEKSYMTIDRMNEINNIDIDSVEVVPFNTPKADGSCLVISTELIKSGVNIPHGIIHNAEDISFCEMAKLVMGDKFIQYHVQNILRVHNRRHPKKRIGVLGETNPNGFCDERKGEWWKILEARSNENYQTLRLQHRFVSVDDVIDQIRKL